MKITKLETFLVKPRSLFLKIHTDEGLIGLGEPILEGRALTCAQAVAELEPYLIGQDPRRVVHHWQAMYRHAFYRGGPLRDRIRVYRGAGGDTPKKAAESAGTCVREGYTAMKASVHGGRPARIVESPAFVQRVAANFAAMRDAVGPKVDIAIDFHGAISPQTSMLLIKALEPYQPMFIEEPVQCQNVAVLADLARKTHIPIATGERIFTKWGFREILEKRAASILQPDLSHAGGIFECRLIAGMAESYYAGIAPHCPLGPIALAACLQLDASIPNFLIQEQGSLGVGYLKQPFVVKDGFIELPQGPGLGIELDEDALADKIIQEDWKNPRRTNPDDGSVVDW